MMFIEQPTVYYVWQSTDGCVCVCGHLDTLRVKVRGQTTTDVFMSSDTRVPNLTFNLNLFR